MKLEFFRIYVMDQFRLIAQYFSRAEAQLQDGHHVSRLEFFEYSRSPIDDSEQAVAEWMCRHKAELDSCDRQFKVEFSRILRHSTIFMLFSAIERMLPKVIAAIISRTGSKASFNLKKAWELRPQLEAFWRNQGFPPLEMTHLQCMEDLRVLRNCIAHHRGYVQDCNQHDKPRIEELLRRNEGVRLVGVNELADPDDQGIVELSHEYVNWAITSMTALFRDMFDRAGCFGPDGVDFNS